MATITQSLTQFTKGIADNLNGERLKIIETLEHLTRIKGYDVMGIGVIIDGKTIDEKIESTEQAKKDVVWQQKFYTYAHNNQLQKMERYHQKLNEYELEAIENAHDGTIYEVQEKDLDDLDGKSKFYSREGALVRMGEMFKERYDQRTDLINIIKDPRYGGGHTISMTFTAPLKLGLRGRP